MLSEPRANEATRRHGSRVRGVRPHLVGWWRGGVGGAVCRSQKRKYKNTTKKLYKNLRI